MKEQKTNKNYFPCLTFVLENYTLTTSTAEVLETREKRIYAPSFMKLTEEIKKRR